MPNCFIIMPITTPANLAEQYGGDAAHFEHVLQLLFVPAIQNAGYEPVLPKAEGSEIIHARIVQQLESADLVLCDMSSLNANVFFELGIRTAVNRPAALVRDNLTPDIFDTNVVNRHEYDSSIAAWVLQDEIDRLTEHIDAVSRSETNSLWEQFSLETRAALAIQSDSPGDDRLAAVELQLSGVRRELRNLAEPNHASRPDDPPHQFFGSTETASGLLLDGEDAPDGTVVLAENHQGKVISAATTKNGTWMVLVDPVATALVRFRVQGHRPTDWYAVKPGSVTELSCALVSEANA